MSTARTTPAQNPRGAASASSIVMVFPASVGQGIADNKQAALTPESRQILPFGSAPTDGTADSPSQRPSSEVSLPGSAAILAAYVRSRQDGGAPRRRLAQCTGRS